MLASQGSRGKDRSTKESARLITRYAQESGIPLSNLTNIIDLVTRPNYLDKSSIAILLQNLYPATKVPPRIICNIVNSLGQGKHKPTVVTQNTLLRWIILVIPFLEDSSVLQSLYGLLFNLVDFLSIR